MAHFAVLFVVVVRDSVEERQRYLALAQVVAGGLAYGFVFVVVEDVVFYLEAETQEFAEGFEAVSCCIIGIGRYGSYVHTCLEERCRFAADHLEVGCLGEFVRAGIVQLVYLAVSQLLPQGCHHGNDGHTACLNAAFEGARHEEVTYQYGYPVVFLGIDGGLLASEGGVVYDIVVYEAGVVHQLYGCRSGNGNGRYAPGHAGAKQYKNRPYLFAFRLQITVYDSVHEGARCVQPVRQDAV